MTSLYHYHTSNIIRYVLNPFHSITIRNGARILNLGANNLWIVIVCTIIIHLILYTMFLVLFIMTTKNGAKISNLGANNLWIVIV